MVSQITSHEEHAAELTDRIALMEEELRRVRVGFSMFNQTDRMLEPCSMHIQLFP